MDGVTVSVLIMLIGSHVTLWYKFGRLEEKVKNLESLLKDALVIE